MNSKRYYEFVAICSGLTMMSENEQLKMLKEYYPDATEYEVKILVDRDLDFSGLTGRKFFYRVDDLKTTVTLH